MTNFRLRRRDDESGVAMLITVLLMTVLMILPIIVFNDTLSSLPLARHAVDRAAALQAAEAGVEDYLQRLGSTSGYAQYSASNPDSPENPAFTGWVPVPGGSSGEYFRYAVDTSAYGQGKVYLIASGAAGANKSVVRTVKVALHEQGFSDYLYFSDHEIVNPALSGYSIANCGEYMWQLNATKTAQVGYNYYGPDMSSCSSEIISFGNSDVLNGAVATNDAIHVCGAPTFQQNVSATYDNATSLDNNGQYSYGGPGSWLDTCGSGAPSFATASASNLQPAAMPLDPFPTTNTTLQADTTVAHGGGGCSYTGPITVAFSTNAGVGQMTVTLGSGSTATSANPSVYSCTGTVPLPPNGVLYDATASGCGSASCQANVSVSGTVAGAVTVGSDNTITVVGSLLKYGGTGTTNLIGLSAAQYIKIMHGTDCTQNYGNWPADCLPNLEIDAAMVALNGSVYVDNWTSGSPMGTLKLWGSLAQEYRGAVGTLDSHGTVSGYAKSYTWDSYLQYLTPPYFTQPTLPSWSKTSFAECNPVAAPVTTSC